MALEVGPQRRHPLRRSWPPCRGSGPASRRPPGAERPSICSRSTPGVGTARPVGLVDHEQVGDLHQPGLVGLHRVAPPRVDHHHRGVGLAGDLDLDLTDADRLDQHHVEADDVEHPGRLGGGHGQATEVPPGGHRADEHVVVERVVAHADPVAEDRPTGERRRRVDGQHADPAPVGPGLRRRARW